MKPYLILLAALALLPSCNTNYRTPMVTQTITRPVVESRFSSARGTTITTTGVETITTEQPYQSPAYQQAGAALFSR
jgi:uncharacterized lipoprotein YajG